MTDVRLIIGPPGTGKTSALTTEAAHAADQHGADAVAIASLTRTAAAEIASRTEIPNRNVGTLHAHAWHALDRPALAETPEGLRAWTEDHPDLKLSGGRTTLDDLDTPAAADDAGKTPADELHQAVQNHRARLTPPDQWSDAERDHHRRWTDWCQQTGRLDFTALIERAIRDIDQHPAHPHTLLGDEAQDFSALELALFRKWAAAASEAVIAADPDQTIYAWRGANPDAFRRIPDQDVRVLGQSYRVSRAVHAAATRWIHQIADRRDAAYRPRPAAGAFDAIAADLGNPDPLLEHLRAETDAGRTVMLLASCGYMLTPTLAALKQAGIPFANPLRPERGQWNPLRGAGRLAAFLRPKRSVWGDQARAWTWDDLRTWTEPLQASGTLTRGSKQMIESKCLEDRWGDSQADHPVGFDALCSLFGIDDSDEQLELDSDQDATVEHPAFVYDVDWWESRLLASARDRMAYPLAVYRRHGGQALIDEPKITIGTIHSVKGGEADTVILSPDLSRIAMWHGWHRGGPARDHTIRTFYVGVTRARDQVKLLAPSNGEHIPTNLLIGEAQPDAIAA